MCRKFTMHLLIFTLAIVSAIGVPGCTGNSSDPDAAASGDADQASANGSVVAEVSADPQPFDSIPLSKDTSYEVPPTPAGTAAGEIRELTALKIKFCWCPGGTFKMGSPADAPGSERNEPQFEVSLTQGYWLQQTELTQAQYELLMGTNPAHFRGEANPVESVTFAEAKEFCRRLSELPPEKNSGNLYRLPTEAEWEYACRAGSTTGFSFGDDEALMEDYGWFNRNSSRTTHPVGLKKPNDWGLHDLHGNVGEWCGDYYGEYPAGPVTDPGGPESGGQIAVRGGGWFFVPQNARSAHRDAYPATARYAGLGFRLVAQPSQKTP
jgi:formylglycine-generating enzyme required for sulfatase activity